MPADSMSSLYLIPFFQRYVPLDVGIFQSSLRDREAELWLPIITFSDDLNTNCAQFSAPLP